MAPVLFSLLTLLATGTPGAPEDDTASLLAEIDGVLAPTGARREPLRESPVCSLGRDSEPGSDNRGFFCEATSTLGSWRLANLRADGGARVSADLELRRFSSPQAAQEAKRTALERYGGKRPASVPQGAISWCYLTVYWTEAWVMALRYGCHISLSHVKALKQVRALLRARSTPFGESRAAGVIGIHSGWSGLLDTEDRILHVPDALRFHHFVRVVDVKANDVLWIREKNHSGAPRVDKLAPTARCIPRIFARADSKWVLLKGPTQEGWAHKRYLRDEAPEDCPRPADTP